MVFLNVVLFFFFNAELVAQGAGRTEANEMTSSVEIRNELDCVKLDIIGVENGRLRINAFDEIISITNNDSSFVTRLHNSGGIRAFEIRPLPDSEISKETLDTYKTSVER